MNRSATTRTLRQRRLTARGMALLVVLFVMTLASLTLVGMLGSLTASMAAQRNVMDHERALYLAGAAVHTALAELEIDPGYSDDIPLTALGTVGNYSATLAPVGDGTVVVTGTGISGASTRKLQATIDFGSG